ncbi:FtsW/RodA/SpoVE family cell cycle protein [Shigella flexneri]
MGLVGVVSLLALYSADHARAVDSRQSANHLGRVMAGGLMLILFVYVFVNIGMVSGICRL